MTFADLDIHPALLAELIARGYAEPTAVQSAVLDPAHKGRDLLVSSKTGSGKTVAFGLAASDALIADLPEGAKRLKSARMMKPRILVVAPTRELALQVQRELAWLYAGLGARVASCVGGVDIRREMHALDDGVHIVVGTPGRLCDHIDRKSLDLSQLRAVILDEADEMLDMGFRDDLERILSACPVVDAKSETPRRTLLFSATLPNEIVRLAQKFQTDAVRIAASVSEKAHQDITYVAHMVSPRERENAVVNVLRFHEAPCALVFCAMRDTVTRVASSLTERGFSAVALSGELSQNERNRALQALRDGRARVLVATDVASRGLDLPDVSLVVHADVAMDAESMIHRSGRTGRAGKKGTAVVLAIPGTRRAAERHLLVAGARVQFTPPPTREQVRALDDERLLESIASSLLTTESDDDALVDQLLAKHEPRDLVRALVQARRSSLPEPEDLFDTAQMLKGVRTERRPSFDDRGPPMDDRRPTFGDRRPAPMDDRRPARADARRHEENDRAPPRAAAAPAGKVGMTRAPASSLPAPNGPNGGVWFRVNVGRAHHADPKWLVPLLCRRGNIKKDDLGRIAIGAKETHVEIAPHLAARFSAAVQEPDAKDPRVKIVPLDD